MNNGIRTVSIDDPAYPQRLRRGINPPSELYLAGNPNVDLNAKMVAIVGTRRPTGYGLNVAEAFASELAAAGLAVISGLARGIDAAAHRGALRKGVTHAVFGCGLDYIYPKENRKLAELIQQSGCWISEFNEGTPPSPPNFQLRNRIVAALASAVVVIEAAEYSGTGITARLANELGTPVFAVPGNVTSPNSFLPHQLIRDGNAQLVTTPQEVLHAIQYGTP